MVETDDSADRTRRKYRFSPAEKLLTAVDLRRMFRYETATGILRWRYRPEMSPQWNGRYAGTVAGSIKDRDDGIQVRITTTDKMYLVYAHRIAWCVMTGYWPSALIDHRDGNKRNNRWRNLRAATKSENNHNRIKIQGDIPIKGVHFDKRLGKYHAKIRVNGRRKHLGYHDTPFESGLVYDKYSKKYHGRFAAPNSKIHPIPLVRYIFEVFALD